METIKIVLLILAYTLGIATLAIQTVCYFKQLEYKETIIFSLLLLLLVVSLTIPQIITIESPTTVLMFEYITLLFTSLFAIIIPVNIHKLRKSRVRVKRNSIIYIIGCATVILTTALYFRNIQNLTFIIVYSHMFLSVIYSMLYILLSKPDSEVKTSERSEKITAIFVIAIMIISSVILAVLYPKVSYKSIIEDGSAFLATIFIVIAVIKILENIKRLNSPQTENNITPERFTSMGITPREQEVLLLLIKGKKYKEIADKLFISLPTVKTHVSNIYSKTDVRNRIELSNLFKPH